VLAEPASLVHGRTEGTAPRIEPDRERVTDG
jgi:hypothetical protein